MLLTSLFSNVKGIHKAGRSAGHERRAGRRRPASRRGTIERLEPRMVLSGGVVLTAIGWGNASSSDSFPLLPR
jgi:hypothetical protein